MEGIQAQKHNESAVKAKTYGWATNEDVYEELISVSLDGEVTAHHDALDRWADSIRRGLADGKAV